MAQETRMLRATAEVAVHDAEPLLHRLCEHFAEHAEVTVENGRGRFVAYYGTAELEADPGRLRLVAEAPDDVYLSYVKMGLAEHIVEMAEGETPVIRWQGDGVGTVTPPFFREMRVVSARSVTPHMRRVTLAGRDLGRFAEGGLHVRLIFPPKARAPVWPTLGEDGRVCWPGGEDTLQHRVYTIRRIDADKGLVDIDIVLHEGHATPGSDFALNAAAGDIVGMSGPGGGDVPDAKSLLLAGDETALPAIARILEALPETAAATVVVEVDGPADEMPLVSKAATDIRFLHRNGAPAGTCGLVADAVRAVDLARLGERPFVWMAGEFEDFRAVRSFLRKEKRWPKKDHLVVAYWRRGRVGDDGYKED